MASSWFSMDKLTELKGQVKSAAGAASAAAGQAASAAQAAIPIDEDLIKKLTLNTDELKTERERIDAEERRREEVKNDLSTLLPWETRDEEREILCEECKEAILSLSTKEETFTAPNALPGQTNADVAAQNGPADGKAKEGEEGENQQQVEAGGAEADGEEAKSEDEKKADAALKAAEVEAKKAKLEPLPPLLADFDLDAHVGLIQRLFEVDPNLVEMHANLSGAGEREKCFWKNYFFHCAFTRYEAGLSVDEIWGDKPVVPGEASPFGGGSSAAGEDSSTGGGGEETVTFEPETPPQTEGSAGAPAHAKVSPTVATPAGIGGAGVAAAAAPASAGSGAAIAPATAAGAPPSSQLSSSDYEVISGAAEEDNDGDLDDLEAEIARELEEEG